MNNKDKPKIEKRDMEFTTRTVTKIWQEKPSVNNPYLAEECRCHGYNILDLMRKRSLVDVLFLLIKGELPTKEEARLLEHLMIAFINPGPRHPATRAAMNVSVSKTHTHHILPIALSVLGGSHLGAEEVVSSMRFILAKQYQNPGKTALDLLETEYPPDEGDWHIAPGFGTRFGDIDPMPDSIAAILLSLPGSGRSLLWCSEFVQTLKPHKIGWLSTGLCSAAFCDLGFSPWIAAGLFQIINAPGILAHGLELANQPITAMPFLDKENYIIDEKVKKRSGFFLKVVDAIQI